MALETQPESIHSPTTGREPDRSEIWSALTDLPLLTLRVTACARDPIDLPEHAGSTLRGAFGHGLKQLVCVHPERTTCVGCPEEGRCAYPALFEPRAAAEAAGFSGFENLPRPYVFRAALGAGWIEPGERFTWYAALVGSAIPHLPYCVLAWRAMGANRIGLRAGGKGQGYRI